MKNTSARFILSLLAVSLLAWSAAGTALADDHHDAWSHDHSGYWDDHGHHQAYVEHNHHRGYWRTHDNGSRVFININ